MFVFEDILKTDSKGMRKILKNIETRELIFALKTASGEMKEKVFASLSQRAAEMLREDMEVVGAVRLSEVEAAQRNIVRIARELESEGKIIIGASKEDIFV
jgi:flagellar motor switch protein FliG